MSGASKIIGSTPPSSVRAVSLPVHHCLSRWVQDSELRPLVLVACSGGADSMALAISAIDSAHRLGCEVHTITVDHGLRDGSAQEAESVAAFLETMGARAHVVGPEELARDHDSAQREGSGVLTDEGVGPVTATATHFRAMDASTNAGPEGNARALRYQAISECATRIRQEATPRTPVLVLLGHTMDDQAETVLLRLARGSGVGSLKAMAETSILQDDSTPGQENTAQTILLRPLLSLRREDTQAFCAALACPVVDDPTNALDGPWRSADGSPLRRSAIRHSALPALHEALGVDPVPALARTAALARDDDEALEDYARQAYAAALVHLPSQTGAVGINVAGLEEAESLSFSTDVDKVTSLILTISPLLGLPRAVRRRVLLMACLQAGVVAGQLSAQHLMAVDELIVDWKGQGPLHLPRLHVWRHKTPHGNAVISFTPTST